MPDLRERLQDTLVDRYRFERELGRGGMATVFLAEDLKHHRHVAVKVLDPEVAAAIGPERFLREIETVAGLQHPHILPLHDSGVADGLLFYVMPYVRGESLRDRLIREKQLPLDDALRITHEVADALGHAHRHGVVHRDIKPENILLEEPHAVVADFGVARAVAAAESKKLTTAGVMVGTPAYMSPEQAAGGTADSRSDIYGLGCVLYEMLAGQALFTGPTAESVMFQHLNAAPPRVTALRPSLPAGLDQVIVKALAKTPVDRYASAAEFDAALSSALNAADALPTPAIGRHRLVWAVVAAATVVVALIAVAVWQEWGPFGGRSAAPAKKDWILVAEFDSAPEDSAVAMASHDLLSAALDQSKIVATVTPDQIKQGLRLAGKPANTRVDAQVARELAYRSAVRAVLEGKIGRLGPAYSIVLRLVDADSARVILTEDGVAKNQDALVPALGGLAKRLRAGLGENHHALAATREMTLVATPSFEAYRLYVQALRVWRAQLAGRKTLGLLRAAVALDPDFATAWTLMGVAYSGLTYPDSARACFDRAASRPDRMTEAQRRRLEVFRMADNGDALAACDQMLADDPNDWWALSNSNDMLVVAGRFEEALERTRAAMKVGPFGATDGTRVNLVTDLVLLGRFDEAREAASHMTGVYRANLLYSVERGANRWAVAESIAVRNLDDPRVNADFPGVFLWYLGQTQFARGDLRVARATLARSVAMSVSAQDPAGLEWDRLLLVEYAVVSHQVLPLPPDAELRDTSATSVLTRGLAATATGELALARRSLVGLQGRSARALALQGAGPALLEARIATLAAQPMDAVALLRPFAVARVDPGFPGIGVGLTWVRWSLADAFERLGQPDSAAVYLERGMSVPTDTEVWPFVHLRLTLLYARMGRVAEAERHLAAVEQAWDRPDPEVRRMLEEARSAVASARGMARPEAPGVNTVAPGARVKDARGAGR